MEFNSEQIAVPLEQQTDSNGEVTIDIGRILRALLHYLWVIIVATVLGALIMLIYTKLFITEMYTSSATIYVKNLSSSDQTSSSISNSDTYVAEAVTELITDYKTITMAIEENGLSYIYDEEDITYDDIVDCITTSVGEAGNLYLSVTYSDPEIAAEIANAILSVLEERASQVYGSYVYVSAYSEARVPTEKSSPNTFRNVILGALVGAVISCVVIVVMELLNNKIYDKEYLITTYNLPVLTEIPDFSDKKAGMQKYKYGYGYDKANS